jgi:hypothetical protein
VVEWVRIPDSQKWLSGIFFIQNLKAVLAEGEDGQADSLSDKTLTSKK